MEQELKMRLKAEISELESYILGDHCRCGCIEARKEELKSLYDLYSNALKVEALENVG